MTSNALLRLLSSSGTVGLNTPAYELPGNREVVIGREPSCQIVLNNSYGTVSRRHAVFRLISELPAPGMPPTWEICDLNSANGTYVNGQRLQGCQKLQVGSRIILGDNGPEFIFEYPSPNQALAPPQVLTPVAAPSSPQPDALTLTQLFPIFSTGRDLTRKAFLIPGIITVIFVVLMFATVGPEKSNFIAFSLLLAIYLAGGAFYFVYQLCGKHKPWWLLFASAITTALILKSPIFYLVEVFFNDILPGGGSMCGKPGYGLPLGLVQCLFGAGLPEELLKALPVLGAYLIGRLIHSPWRENIGVWEPLDGILLGAASSVGFTLVETLLLYVPRIIETSGSNGLLVGLQLLIPRILGGSGRTHGIQRLSGLFHWAECAEA